MSGFLPLDVCRHLAARGIFASHGDFYASTAIERLGHAPEGLVRIGLACYSTADEIDRLLFQLRALRTT
jgi:selenocysteine lyase/cysteine desulfurase